MAVTQAIQEQMLKEAYSATPNYSIDYNDPRFGNVQEDKNQALTDLEQTYAGMIGNTNSFYQKQIDNLENWKDEQLALKDQQTDFAIDKINQQKDQAHKDYLKEQSGAYVDWQKQSNQYGTNAEQMASAGMTNTGFAESSQVGMYNTYQLRVASARESFERARLNYDNLIREAQLENNAAKAEIAFQTLQKSLELALEGFQYENDLLREKANKKFEIDNVYYTRYQDVLDQINHENAVKEDIRQYNETQKWNTEQAEKNREHDKTMADIEYQYQVKRDEATRTYNAEQARLDRAHEIALVNAKTEAEKQRIADQLWADQQLLKQKHNNEIALLDKQLANEKALINYGNVAGGGTQKTLKQTVKTGGSAANETFISQVRNNPRTTNKTVKSNFTGSTYNEAVAYMKKNGVSTAGILTASEWSRRKSSYSMTGIGNAAVKNYKSYAEYLRAYVNSTVANK